MNSEASMVVMREDKLKKAKEVAEKQKRFREREEKKEYRRKEEEEKKRKAEKIKSGKVKAAKVTKKKKTSAKDKGKQWRQALSLEHNDTNSENICQVCLGEYDEADDENMPWVMCDNCKLWMHMDCIPIGIDTSPITNDVDFFVTCVFENKTFGSIIYLVYG
jgi:hypothetical protein